jgi:hypothetical protein
MAVQRKTVVSDNTGETRLDDNVSEPSTNAPGDAPYDTTDPTERASTVTPTPSAEALKAGTVNGVLPLPKAEPAEFDGEVRTEEFDAIRPNGDKVRVRLTLDGPDAGKSEVV